MSKVQIGAKFTNKQGCELTVVAKTEIQNYWLVSFESGYTTIAKDSNIPYGKVKDFFYPSVYGIGYLGCSQTIPNRGECILRKKYDLWANMLKRVEGNYKCSRPSYKNVTIAPEWLNFSVFQLEIESVEGYEAWVKDSTLCLDKDLAQQKLYSRATCKFISLEENTRESANRRWANAKA